MTFLFLDTWIRLAFDGVEEEPGIGMLGIGEYPTRVAGFHHLTAIHDSDSVAHIGHSSQVVGDEHDGSLGLSDEVSRIKSKI